MANVADTEPRAGEHQAQFRRGIWSLMWLSMVLGPVAWIVASIWSGVSPTHEQGLSDSSALLGWSFSAGLPLAAFGLMDPFVRPHPPAWGLGSFYASVVALRVAAFVYDSRVLVLLSDRLGLGTAVACVGLFVFAPRARVRTSQ